MLFNDKKYYKKQILFTGFLLQFCNMSIHRGQFVKNKLDEIGVKISKLAPKLDYSRGHLYKFFDMHDLPYKVIYKIGEAINYDFSFDFPDMPVKSIEKNIVVAEEEEVYGVNTTNVYELKKAVILWRDRYYALLEKYSKLLENK